MQHFISIADTSADCLKHILDVAFELRRQRDNNIPHNLILKGKTLALFFEKQSLRTRVSFEQGMIELGGHTIVLDQQGIGLGQRETVHDVIKVLSGMVHGLAARVYEHDKLLELAKHGSIPVINALSDESHPCQALADIMTIKDEFSQDLTGRTIAYIGDGNNVALSLACLCGKLGIRMVIASPAGYELKRSNVDRIMAQQPDMDLKLTSDPVAAVHDADVVYTDTWVSMGQEDQVAQRQQAFAGFCVDETLMRQAPNHAIVLHCLPAHRGCEITDAVMDGPQSRVFQQAHNRLHAQKGLLAVLLGNR